MDELVERSRVTVELLMHTARERRKQMEAVKAGLVAAGATKAAEQENMKK